MTTTITPFLWFDNDAEEAFAFYATLFPDTRLVDGSRGPDGAFFFGTFELLGKQVMAMNAGPSFPHTQAFSFFTQVDDQAEVDRLWNALTADGGEESQCGWLKDKFGVSWQIVPEALMRLQQGPDAAAAARVTQAMLGMRKIIVADLEAAYAG